MEVEDTLESRRLWADDAVGGCCGGLGVGGEGKGAGGNVVVGAEVGAEVVASLSSESEVRSTSSSSSKERALISSRAFAVLVATDGRGIE